MLKIGITGGIGSGKTTVCRIFASLGIPVYYADERAKWLMVHDPVLTKSIKTLFGEEAYFPNGQLNRKHLSDIIFSEPQKREQMNALVHPAVWRDGEQWNATFRDQPYTLKEAALIFESGGNRQLDKVIVVTAPVEIRIDRVVQRDQVDPSAVQARISAQMPESEKVALADFVINNDGEHFLIPQVLKTHQALLQLAAEQ